MIKRDGIVTPYVGVWIETKGITVLNGIAKSLLMWECGLKRAQLAKNTKELKSLLMWECGLKLRQKYEQIKAQKSLLMWECGLKHPER